MRGEPCVYQRRCDRFCVVCQTYYVASVNTYLPSIEARSCYNLLGMRSRQTTSSGIFQVVPQLVNCCIQTPESRAGDSIAIHITMLYCNPPEHYYVCANGFQGCCDTNPCPLPEPTCPCTSSTTDTNRSGTAMVNGAGQTLPAAPQASSTPSSIPLAAMPIPFASAITEPSSIFTPTPTIPGSAGNVETPILVDTRPLTFPAGGSQTAMASSLFASIGDAPSDVSTDLQSRSGTTIRGSASATSTGPSSQATSPSEQGLPSSGPKAGAVTGGVLGGLVFAVLALLLLLCCRKRRFRRKTAEEKKADVLVRTMYEYEPARETRDAGTVGAAI